MAEMTYETILINKGNGIAWVTFNRPDKRNAISPQVAYDMVDALTKLDTDADVRVLVLTGAREAFSAGMDLKRFFRDLDDKPVERGGGAQVVGVASLLVGKPRRRSSGRSGAPSDVAESH